MTAEMAELNSWLARATDEEVIRYRDAAMAAIEKAASEFMHSGAAEKWLSDSDPHVRAVSQGVNGPLLEYLIMKSSHPDSDCANLFKHGAQLMGMMPRCCLGEERSAECAATPVSELRERCAEHNAALVKRMKPDDFEELAADVE